MYWPGDHQLGFAVNGSRKFYMSETQGYFQNLSSGISISAGGIDVTGDSTFAGNVTINKASNPTSLQIGSSLADDPFLVFQSDGNTMSMGIDRSDSNKFVISDNATLGTNNRLTIDTSGNTIFTGNVTATYFGRDAHNRIDFQTDDSIIYRVADTHRFRMDSDNFSPYADSSYDLGTSSLYFRAAYIDAITTTGNLTVGGTITSTGLATFNDGITLGGSNETLKLLYNNTANYIGNLGWAYLQLGNNGSNDIVAGNTGAGGQFRFFTNNTTDIGGDAAPNGTLALTLAF